jgi:predicted transport protein
MIQKLEAQTGKPFSAWLDLVRQSGLAKHGEIVNMLKSSHGITHGYANLIAHQAMQSDASFADAEDLIAAQYAGEKAALRPIYDRLIDAITAFGADVELAPKKGYVSVRRSKQFALVQPSTKTRIDVGIQLKGVAPAGRLEASGSFNAMVSHRVRVENAAEVDAQLIGWLKQAYDAA